MHICTGDYLLQYETSLECKCGKFIEPLPTDERGDLKVTGKIWKICLPMLNI